MTADPPPVPQAVLTRGPRAANRWPPPLRYLIPAVFLVLGLVIVGVSFRYGLLIGYRRLEQDMTRDVWRRGRWTVARTESLLAGRRLNELERVIHTTQSYPDLRTMFLVDPSLRIIAGAADGGSGKPLGQTSWAWLLDTLRPPGGVSLPRILPHRDDVVGLFPVRFPSPPDQGRVPVMGWLIVAAELTPAKRAVWSDAVAEMGLTAVVLVGLCFLAWVGFDRLLSRRLHHLLSFTRGLASGDLGARVRLSGADELAQLGHALEATAGELRTRTAALEAANTRLQREVGERQETEQALRASEQQARATVTLLTATLESTSDGILVVDRSGKVINHNALFARMWQIPEALLVSRDDARLLEFALGQLVDPEGFLRKVRELYDRPEEKSIDELRFKDGRVFERYSQAYRIGGEPMGRVWSFRDVTERQLAAAALTHERDLLQALMDNIPDTVYFKDTQSRFRRINQAQAQALGVAAPAEAVGKTDADFFNVEHAQAALLDEQRILATGQPIVDKTERLRRADGQWRWISATKVPFRDASGQVVGTLGVSRDVTERKEAEEQRLALERKLLDAQKLESLGVLAGGVAHDFNNLLTAVIGNAGLATMDLAETSPCRRYLANIEDICLQAAGLCNQMLAYAGRGQMSARRLNLNTLLADMAQLLQISISKKNVLRLQRADASLAVIADAAQVRQVVLNLVVNASEAIGDTSGTIRVATGMLRADRAYLAATHLSPDLPAGDYVYVEVSDTGCGMDADTAAKIFDPFFTTKFRGRGLGLAAVLGIVRGHRGAIKVDTEPGRGSTFKVLLPAAGSLAEEGPAAAPCPAKWQGTGTVLVVDDEESVRTTVAQQLEAFGFKVLLAGDGREAVEVFRAHAPQIAVVVLDLTMPHLSGLEAFQEMRRCRSEVRVLLMSGYNEEDATGTLAGGGLAGFLHKPFTPAELREKVRAIVENSTK